MGIGKRITSDASFSFSFSHGSRERSRRRFDVLPPSRISEQQGNFQGRKGERKKTLLPSMSLGPGEKRKKNIGFALAKRKLQEERGEGGLAKNSGLGRRNCKVSFFSRGCFFPPPPGSSSLADDLSEELSASFFSTSFRRERAKRVRQEAKKKSLLSFELKHSCCPPPPARGLPIYLSVRAPSSPLSFSAFTEKRRQKSIFFCFFCGVE